MKAENCTPEALELVTLNQREQVAFLSLGLGYRTLYDIF